MYRVFELNKRAASGKNCGYRRTQPHRANVTNSGQNQIFGPRSCDRYRINSRATPTTTGRDIIKEKKEFTTIFIFTILDTNLTYQFYIQFIYPNKS